MTYFDNYLWKLAPISYMHSENSDVIFEKFSKNYQEENRLTI